MRCLDLILAFCAWQPRAVGEALPCLNACLSQKSAGPCFDIGIRAGQLGAVGEAQPSHLTPNLVTYN
jgi:hypothetical protein